MISKEKANEWLQQHKIEDPIAAAFQRVQQLDKPLNRLGLLLLDKAPEYERANREWSVYKDLQEKREQEIKSYLQPTLDSTNIWKGKYFEVLQAIFGDWAAYVRTAWNRMTTLMYQTNWSRRSFRAPHAPQVYYEKQVNWLTQLISQQCYDVNLPTYARYIGYIDTYSASNLTHIFAAAMEMDTEEGQAIFKILIDTIYDRDEIAKVSRTGIKSLLLHDNREGWTAVEKLLLAAQRQEGLRQTVLECLDETHLEAQKSLMKVILDNNLTRFSAVVRALDVWCGMMWESAKPATIQRCVAFGLTFLDAPETIKAGLDSKDNLEVYMALWAGACMDIMATLPHIAYLLEHKTMTKKMIALLFLQQTQLSHVQSHYAVPFLKEKNLSLVAAAFPNVQSAKEEAFPTLFDDLINLWERLPSKGFKAEGKVFAWASLSLDKETVMRKAIDLCQEKDGERLLPYFEKMTVNNRNATARLLLWEKETFSPELRDFVFLVLTDRSEWTRDKGFEAVKKMNITAEEAIKVEALLTRKNASLRKGAIEVLYQQTDPELLASTQRLLAARKIDQRLAGLDILSRLHKDQKLIPDVQKLVAAYLERSKISNKEQLILSNLSSQEVEFNAENGYGLYEPSKLTTSPKPVHRLDTAAWLERCQQGMSFDENQNNIYRTDSKKLVEVLKDLLALIEKHKDVEYEVIHQDGTKSQYLIGNTITPQRYIETNRGETNLHPRELFELLPLSEVWENWYLSSGMSPIELMICKEHMGNDYYYSDDSPADLLKLYQYFLIKLDVDIHYSMSYNVQNILTRLSDLYPPQEEIDFYLDINETFLASIPTELLNKEFVVWRDAITWRDVSASGYWLKKVASQNKNLSKEQTSRLWHLQHWVYQSAEKTKEEYKPNLVTYLSAHEQGIINRHDLTDKILHSRDGLRTLTAAPQILAKNHSLKKFLTEDFHLKNEVQNIVVACRNRILDIELKRGDSGTVFSTHALALQNIYGIQHLCQILQALQKETLHRGYIYSYSTTPNKKEVFSHLLKVSFPEKMATSTDFIKAIKPLNISEQRLIDVAMYAPQWLPMIKDYLKWKGLAEGVWWLQAHTKESGYSPEQKWESQIQTYTPLNTQDLTDGAVDVDWFKRSYKQLRKQRWKMLYQSAKYISDGAGHRRAQIFADAMLGTLKLRELTTSIKNKRRQDYVRALGLVPLNRRNPSGDILKRYQLLQQFLKESKQFGAQRQTSEKLAVRIGLENLARTAGYADPIRLTWAMEAQEAADILEKAKPVTLADTTVELWIDDMGKAHLSIDKKGKQLKSIPAKIRKDKQILQLKAFQKTLKNQYARTRLALEEAMCRGDIFSPEEIKKLAEHPVVSPMLSNLVLVNEQEGQSILGYWKNGALILPYQAPISIEKNSSLRLAHCTDLQASGHWSALQRDCFEQKRKQPFKQIFRELYLPTADELAEATISRRYAGHQVQPQKTVALLKSRAWTADAEEGLRKVYHREGLVVQLYAMADWFTPADVEAPTLETISFTQRETGKRVPFTDISPLIFSEVMRDMDLVVSVAHAGGVDPEASHSTIEMRTVMVEETCRLLQFKNVRTEKNHILIKGTLGDYSVHLGSGVVHRMPGGYLSILPVHSAHRGRIFLPFADDDPKTAEILSKVLLLAEDGKIKDPTVLRQL